MRELLHAKAAQNNDVQECLRRTGTKQIIENSPWDSYWGCGPNGNGKNMTGKILMEVRDQLMR
jgi:N-glycosidase YbiA